VLAKYLPRHLPGQPAIIVQNMPQAQSIVAANFLHVRAPRDGTMLGSISRNFPSQAVLGQANIEADPRRLIWLGATSFPGRICTAWATAPVKTAADLFTHELIVGGSGAASTLSIVPTVLMRDRPSLVPKPSRPIFVHSYALAPAFNEVSTLFPSPAGLYQLAPASLVRARKAPASMPSRWPTGKRS